MSKCLCDEIPRERTGQVISPMGKVLHAFHLECPQHGVTDRGMKDMRQVMKRAWLTPNQARGVLANTVATLIEKHASGRVALIEWVEWELT